LVESADPLWECDRDLEAMNPDFRQALARLVPVFMPDLLFRLAQTAASNARLAIGFPPSAGIIEKLAVAL
jgi:hypothetical protein